MVSDDVTVITTCLWGRYHIPDDSNNLEYSVFINFNYIRPCSTRMSYTYALMVIITQRRVNDTSI